MSDRASLRFLAIVLALAVVGGVAGGIALDQTRGKFDKEPPAGGLNPTDEQIAQYARQRRAALRYSAAFSTGLAGAFTFALLGCAVGLARRSPFGVIFGLVVGSAAGAAFAGGGGIAGQQYYLIEASSNRSPGLMQAVVMQLTYWVPGALAVTLAIVPMVRLRSSLPLIVSMLAAGLVASVLVPIVGSMVIVFSGSHSRDVIPPETLAHCLSMSLAGAVVLAFFMWAMLRPIVGQTVD